MSLEGNTSGKQAKKTLFLALSKLGPSIVLSLVLLSAYTNQAHAGFFDWLTGGLTASVVAAENDNTLNSQTMPLLHAVLALNPDASQAPDITVLGGTALLPESGPVGTSADLVDGPTSDQISLYVVRKGDTIGAIAKMFGVSVNTIMWGNDLKTSVLTEGQQLVILPISGVKVVVKTGDTVQSIAKKYKGDVTEILQFNDISIGDALTVGDTVIVPDGELTTPPVVAKKKITSRSNPAHDINGPDLGAYFGKPLATYVETQGLHGFNAVDLAAPKGSAIYASAEGDVIISRNSGWNGGYGNYVVISHGGSIQTLYSHATQVITYVGEHVMKGQLIGYVGATGKATGPHLHFEVRGAKNPF